MAPAPPPSNALWLTFIGAWREEAQARGSKAAQTYHKAYKSLSACPIPFQHPCQTTQLVGIGPTIASRLEEELQAWCNDNGEAMPERPQAATAPKKKAAAKSAAATATGAAKTTRAKVTSSKASTKKVEATEDDDDDDSSDANDDATATSGSKRSSSAKSSKAAEAAAAKKPRVVTKKPYVPLHRSGGYGLLLGLFSKTHAGLGGEEVYLSKAELVEAAQPYSDSDYLNGGANSRSNVSASTALPLPSQAVSDRTAPRSFYSAWSSMKKLITKGYIYQTGNPPRFCLSEQGFTVAQTMAKDAGVKQADCRDGGGGNGDENDMDAGAQPAAGPSRLAAVDVIPSRQADARAGVRQASKRVASSRVSPSRNPSERSPVLRYAYLLADEASSKTVLSRSDAAQRLSRSGKETCYRIRFPRSFSSHETVAHFVELIEEDEGAPDLLTGYLREAKADLVAPGLKGSCNDADHGSTVSGGNDSGSCPTKEADVEIALIEASSDDEIKAESLKRAETTTTTAALSSRPCAPQRRVPRLSSIIPAPGAESSWHGRLLPPPRANSSSSSNGNGNGCVDGWTSSGPTAPGPHRRVLSGGSVDLVGDDVEQGPHQTVGESASALDVVEGEAERLEEVTLAAEKLLLAGAEGVDAEEIPAFEAIRMPRGSFTIHFILDNRERRHSRDVRGKVSLAPALEAKGVAVEVRALELGDAIWIARRKDGGGAEGDEVVLDVVVERKRLDDLTSSIWDGRWKDQKFRLSSSGLSQVIYLIEDHDVDNQMRKFGEQIQTALSSTQVVDGFFVERTSGLDASIDYLVRMDRIVREMYGDADLTILPDAVVSRSSYTQLQGRLRATRPDVTYLTTFAAYQSLNGKSASLTLRDVFGKMLLCIRGMSAEKVREVLELWQTPREFWEAYEALEGDEGSAAAVTMLANRINPPEQRKKVGNALSAKTHAVFRSQSYAG